nr:hypothetical protein [Tanacetum cinerariifolium]
MESQKSFNKYTQTINDLNHTISKMKEKLYAHQETISILSQQKEAQLKHYKTHEDNELDKVIALENKVKEMVADLRYFNSLELEVDSLRSQLETQKTQFLNEIDRLSREYYYADHMNAILGVYTELDEVTNLQCDYLELLKKCECLEKELSKSKMMSKSFETVQKHAINLELELQQCKKNIKNDKLFKVNQSKDFCKEREQYFEIEDLKAQLQDKGIVIIELKKLIEKQKEKSVDTKFEKSSVIQQPNAFKSQRPSIFGKPTVFSDSLKRKDFSKSKSVTKNNVSNDFSKPVTAHTLPPNKKSILKNTNVLALGMYKLHTELVEIVLFSVDSGCSKHMTGNLKLLINFVEKFLGTVKFGNDQIAPILGYVDLVQGAVTIKPVYYVEGLNHNLFFVGQFCDANLEVAFWKSTCYIRDLKGNDLLTYSPWLWHRRLSHLYFDTINLLSKNDIVVGLPKLKFVKDHLCSSCELGKAKRKSFYTKITPSSKRRLQLLHIDLCGPMRVTSINGKRYVLVIVYDYSRYTWTHFLRSKDETPKVLIDFLRLVQRGLQAQVRIVRTHKGTEFQNQTLHAVIVYDYSRYTWTHFLRSKDETPKVLIDFLRLVQIGLQAQVRIVRTHKGTEFQNQTLHAYLLQKGFFTKRQLLEHLNKTALSKDGTEHLDGENLNKMKEKGNACIFVRYSTQSRAYRVFNKRTRVIVETIHVNFDELPQMASDPVSSDCAPEYRTVTTSNELDFLFSLMFDELLNGSSHVMSKSSVVSADALNQRQQQQTTPLNNHITPESTCHDPTQAPTIASTENMNQAELVEEYAQVENDEFINIFCTPVQDRGETSSQYAQVENDEFINIFCTPVQDRGETLSRHVDSSNMHIFYQHYPFEHRWMKDHPLEQVIRNPSQSGRTRRQLESDGIQIHQSQSPRGIFINQAKYAQEILIKHVLGIVIPADRVFCYCWQVFIPAGFDILSKSLSRSLTCKSILPPWKQARKIYYWDLTSGIRACGELLKRRIYRSDLKPFLTNSKEKPNLISLSKMSDHEDETITQENAPPKVILQITTVTNISTKFPYLKKGEDIWNAIKARFGGNAESKKMQKSLLKQKFKEFKIFEEEGLDKGYDKMQKILIQMNTLKIKPEPEDVNMKSLRGLPLFWSGGQNGNNYQKYKSKEAEKDGSDSKAIGVVDGTIDWDKQTEEGNTEPRSLENFGMIAGIKIESDANSKGEVVSANDAIPAGVFVFAGNVVAAIVSPQSETEFALMGLSTEGQPIYNRFGSVDHMKAVPPPLTGNYMPPFNIPDIDESQMVYEKKATDSSEIKTNDDSTSYSNDSVLFYFSDRSSEPSTNDLQTCDSSVEYSRPNYSDHDSTDSISSVFAPASESRDTIVIDCDRQEDFLSVCTSSIETYVKSSKTLCNKFGSFNKESHFRKHKFVASKSCYVCVSYLHLIKYYDLHEQRFTKRNAKGKGILGRRPTGKPVNPNRPKSVSTGQQNPVSAVLPNPVFAGQQNTVSAGQPNLVSAGQQNTVSAGQPNPVSAGQPNPVCWSAIPSFCRLNGKTAVKPSAGWPWTKYGMLKTKGSKINDGSKSKSWSYAKGPLGRPKSEMTWVPKED